MRKIIIAVLLSMTLGMANAATCVSGEYLDANDGCVPCTNDIYYCPGDDMRYECPSLKEHSRTTFPDDYLDARVSRYNFEHAYRNKWEQDTDCRAYSELENSRGTIYEYVTYNPATQQYDISQLWYWRSVKAGYYLTSPGYCGTGAYYKLSMVCAAGGYCPGKDYTLCNESNKATVFTETFGLEVCGDNSYSDAGASSCTPCPNGTGNSGSNLSDHAGVASCKTISCPAGQEVVNYVCTACKAGYYKSSAGSASCTQCTDYKYASGTGNTSCTLPPAGYNSTGCSSGKGCTGQEACGSSWYCPGDGRYYSCPSNSTARTNTSTSADDCLCNSGYVKRSGECKQLCTAGFTTLNSNGVTVNAYTEKLTTPSINISANGKTCYVPLVSGSASGAINVSYDSKTYHTVN